MERKVAETRQLEGEALAEAAQSARVKIHALLARLEKSVPLARCLVAQARVRLRPARCGLGDCRAPLAPRTALLQTYVVRGGLSSVVSIVSSVVYVCGALVCADL